MTTKLAKNDAVTREPRKTTWRRPHYEVRDNKDLHEIRVYLPGVPKGNTEVTLENDQLTIIGRRQLDVPTEWRQLHSELKTADYRLQLQLNLHVDNDKVQAQIADGILHVRLPLAEESKPRQITVE